MVNFGYPYNDLVICKDSTDYLMNTYCVVGPTICPAVSANKSYHL